MPKVQPIPQGFHSVTPSLIIAGTAKAIEFYKKAFGAKEDMRFPGAGRQPHARADQDRRLGHHARRRDG